MLSVWITLILGYDIDLVGWIVGPSLASRVLIEEERADHINHGLVFDIEDNPCEDYMRDIKDRTA